MIQPSNAGKCVVLVASAAGLLLGGCGARTQTNVVLASSRGVKLVAGTLSASSDNGNISGQLTGVYLEPPSGCTITHAKVEIFIDRNGDGTRQPEETSFLDYEETGGAPGPMLIGDVIFSFSRFDPVPTIKLDATIECDEEDPTRRIKVTKPWVPPDSYSDGVLEHAADEQPVDLVKP